VRHVRDDLNFSKSKLHSYRNALMQHVETKYIEWCMAFDESPRLLYVTITFNGLSNLPNVTSVSDGHATHLRVDYAFKHFHRVFISLLLLLLGRNYHRPVHREYQPIAWVCADLPRTKRRKKEKDHDQQGVQRRRTGHPTRLGLHLHVVLLIHPETIKGRSEADLCALIEEAIDRAIGHAVNTVNVEPVPQLNPSQHIARMVNYSSALMMFRSLDQHLPPTDRWDIWPRRSGGSTPASTIEVPPRHQREARNERLNLVRDINADPSVPRGNKLDIVITLANNAGQLEAVYAAIPPWCRSKIKEAFSIILHGQEEDMWRFIRACRGEWETLGLLDIAAPASCSDLAKYATGDPAAPYRRRTPINLQAQNLYNEQIDKKGLTGKYKKIEPGDDLRYLLLVEPNTLQAPAICFSTVFPKEFGLDGYVDRDAQFDMCLRQPLQRALAMVGWRVTKKRTLGVLAQAGIV
jgi:hypothetical protein